MQSENFAKKAKQAYKKGKEELSTGIFKWKPEYNSAVSYFEEAGKLYKSAKDYKSCIESYEKAILCNEKLNEPWAVARNCETITTLIIDQKLRDFDTKLDQIAQKAAQYFKLADSYQNALGLFIKLAKYLVEIGKNDEAISIMKQALNDAEESGKQYNKADVFNYLIELLIEKQQYSHALDLYKKELAKGKTTDYKVLLEDYALITVILCLLMGEEIRAEDELTNAMRLLDGFHKTPEYQNASWLIDYYKEGKQEEFDKILLQSPIKGLYPVCIVRNLKKVKVRKIVILGGAPKPKPAQQQISYVEDDDDGDKQHPEIVVGEQSNTQTAQEEQKKQEEEVDPELQKQLEEALL